MKDIGRESLLDFIDDRMLWDELRRWLVKRERYTKEEIDNFFNMEFPDCSSESLE